jgi:phospholipid/cholesterol/gamma-HCH transport system substrate-binding protein
VLNRSPSARAVVAATAFMLLAFGLALFVWKQFGGGTPLQPKGYRVAIDFSQAQNLLPNADVRVSGVTIGKVVSVTPAARATRAVVEIRPRYVPLRRDVRALVRVKTLLGESFVALTPGSALAPTIPDGGTLPAGNVARPQLLDEALSAFDAPTRRALTAFLRGDAESLRGRQSDLNAALGHLGPTTDQLDELVSLLDAQGRDLSQLISGSATTFAAIDRSPGDLRGLIGSGRRLLETTARSRASLSATIGALPGLERELRLTSDEVGGAATDSAPTVRALLPVRDALTPALAGGTDLARQARSLLRALRPVLTLAPAGLAAARRLVAASPPLLRRLDVAGSDLVPLLQLIGRYKHDIVGALASYASAAEATTADDSDHPRHYVRGIDNVNNEVYQLYEKRPATNRHNAYPPPGWLHELPKVLRAADCQNTANAAPSLDPTEVTPAVAALIPALGGSPPCVVEPPWRFRGVARSYPHLTRAPRTAR